jgi:hypothetical protein
MANICYGSERRAKKSGGDLIGLIRLTESRLGQQLTQQQAEAFAQHSSKRSVYARGGLYTSLAVGSYLWFPGIRDMKFPFRNVKDAQKYEIFPNRFLPVVRGSAARLLWQGTRLGVYLVLSDLFIGTFFTSWGNTAMTVGMYRDERTKPILNALKEKGLVSREVDTMRKPQQSASHEDSPDSVQDPRGDYAASMQDTASYGYGGDGGVDYTEATGSTGVAPTAMRASRTTQQQQSQDSTQAQISYEPQQSPADDPFDLTSDPNSPQYDPSAATRHQQQQKPRRSWASIRNQAQRGSGPPASPNPPNDAPSSSTGGGGLDSYSYSAADAERTYAKERAQREFDEMLDRERKLGESGNESTSSGGSAWGRRRG